MNLGAMVDLGVEPEYLVQELDKLNLKEFKLSFVKDQRKGISGTRAVVDVLNKQKTTFSLSTGHHDDEHNHDHPHAHSHEHPHPHDHGTGSALMASPQANKGHHHHNSRNFSDIKKLISDSTLNENVKKTSLEIFTKIAVAEAKIHNKPVDEVHFHEVGAVDSIVDIIGAAICYHFLKPDVVMCSTIQLGGGFVNCAHGTFPVPAPATMEILKDKPVKTGIVDVETTTPTGAAILAGLVHEFSDHPQFTVKKIGYGIGYRDNAIPNVLRVYFAESADNDAQTETGMATVIECNIDDMNPELYSFVMDRLFEAGADDVYFEPISMKKNRPATKISILCSSELTKDIENILFTETSTLGIRKFEVTKAMLKREWQTLETKWGPVQVKSGILEGKAIKNKPEYEDCRRIALENKIPVIDVYREIYKLLNS